MKNFVIGETAWLTCGGPKMTIHDANNPNWLIGRWFANGELKEAKFSIYELTREDPNKKSKSKKPK